MKANSELSIKRTGSANIMEARSVVPSSDGARSHFRVGDKIFTGATHVRQSLITNGTTGPVFTRIF